MSSISRGSRARLTHRQCCCPFRVTAPYRRMIIRRETEMEMDIGTATVLALVADAAAEAAGAVAAVMIVTMAVDTSVDHAVCLLVPLQGFQHPNGRSSLSQLIMSLPLTT